MEPSARFQQTIPYLLLPVSPSLAALHSKRERRQLSSTASQDPNSCPACGYYLHIGTSTSRVTRSRKSRKDRVLQRTCLACQDIQITPLDVWTPLRNSEAQDAPEARAKPPPQHTLGSHHPNNTLPSTSNRPPATTPEKPAKQQAKPQDKPIRSKSRSKNRTGLQAMLSRNREREKDRLKDTREDRGSLSAFLSNL